MYLIYSYDDDSHYQVEEVTSLMLKQSAEGSIVIFRVSPSGMFQSLDNLDEENLNSEEFTDLPIN